MSKLTALLKDQVVVTVTELPDEWSESTWDEHEAIVLRAGETVGVGWFYDGDSFAPPPREELVGFQTISADETASVRYINTLENAPGEVTFNVNGSTVTVAVTNGTAELEITPSEVGSIRVEVNRPVEPVVVYVEEV